MSAGERKKNPPNQTAANIMNAAPLMIAALGRDSRMDVAANMAHNKQIAIPVIMNIIVKIDI
jgi:hypothetical protein